MSMKEDWRDRVDKSLAQDPDAGNKLFLGRIRVYGSIAVAAAMEPDDMIAHWLISSGFGELTACPECYGFKFEHQSTCTTGLRIAETARSLEWLAKKGPHAR